MPRTSSVSTEQSQSGVELNPEKQAKADPKVQTTACIGKPNAPEFEGFQFDATL